MSNPVLRTLIRKRKDVADVLAAVAGGPGAGVSIEGPDGEVLYGDGAAGTRCAVTLEGEHLGWAYGGDRAEAVAAVLGLLAAREAERKTLAGEVLHLYREVNLIYSFSEKLASTLELDKVSGLTLDEARHLITATDGAVLIRDEATGELRPAAAFGSAYSAASAPAWAEGLLASILAGGQGEIVNDVPADPRHVPNGHAVASLICATLRVKERVTGLIALSSASPLSYAAADLKLLNTLALQTASAIENARLFERTVQAARDRERLAALHKELDVASSIQRAIVPSRFPPFPDRSEFSVHASMTPARGVGGDFFDYFLVDTNRLGFVIADVSGKGVPSALFMAVCRTLLKATAQSGASPDACVSQVNRVLASEGVASMYVTVFYGVLDTRTGHVSYCNGGHNPPYVLRRDGRVEPLAQTGGMAVGLFEDACYEAGDVVLAPGDSLFTYTDGVTEATDPAGEEFTTARLAPCLERCHGLGLDGVIQCVGAEVRAFAGEAPQGDDITMLALRYLA
ncbi:MAG: PP2C family protein-serine/threonine phosphatase [Rhodospirillaceae bacterium]